jgi:hypothetical protein
MSNQRQNKGYEKPFFQPINNQSGWGWFGGSVQTKKNVCRQAKKKRK